MAFPSVLKPIHPGNLFLIDSLGALLSAGMLGLVLPRFEPAFGMPAPVLYFLASLAGVFCIYSGLCYLGRMENWRFYMKIIAITNLLYCGLTLGLVIGLYQKLTALGILYFVLESIVITVLAVFELKTAAGPVYGKADSR
jgi:hypothetical protein